MEKVNGEWIMKERADQDPFAIHGIDDLLALVSKVGFLPLFSNSIKGFFVEEHVTAASWWTGDPATDPWEWRQILASHPDIAYGKFFNNAAGFVGREFFPVLANYRRNGYDFDALYDDGMVSYRANVIARNEVLEHFAVIDDDIVWHGGVNLLGHDDIWDNLMRIKSPIVAAELMDISLGDDRWETWDYEKVRD